MNLTFTGYYDDNGVEIYFGDSLRHVDGYDVTVVEDSDGEAYGVLVTPNENEHFPYSLHEGKGYVVIATTPIGDFTDEEVN